MKNKNQEIITKCKKNLIARLEYQHIYQPISNFNFDNLKNIIAKYDGNQELLLSSQITNFHNPTFRSYFELLKNAVQQKLQKKSKKNIEKQYELHQQFCKIQNFTNLIQRIILEAIIWPQHHQINWKCLFDITNTINRYEATLKSEYPREYFPQNNNYISSEKLLDIYDILKKGLNPDKIFNYCEGKQQKENQICGKAVYVFGPTGSGKSTLIQTMLGYTHDTSQDGSKIITAQKIRPQHQEIIASRGIMSVTSNIHKIKIGIKIKGITQDVWIVDCPGYKDSRGVQIDIANNKLRKSLITTEAKAVAIEVIDFNQLETYRSNSLFQLATLIRDHYSFNHITDLRKFLILIFNKCCKNGNEIVFQRQILLTLEQLSKNNNSNKSLCVIYDYIIQQIKQPRNFVFKIKQQKGNSNEILLKRRQQSQSKRGQIFSLLNDKTFLAPRQFLTCSIQKRHDQLLENTIQLQKEKTIYYLKRNMINQVIYQYQLIFFLKNLRNYYKQQKEISQLINRQFDLIFDIGKNELNKQSPQIYDHNYQAIAKRHRIIKEISSLSKKIYYNKKLKYQYDQSIKLFLINWSQKLQQMASKKTINQNTVKMIANFQKYCQLFESNSSEKVIKVYSKHLGEITNHICQIINDVDISNSNFKEHLTRVQEEYSKMETIKMVCLQFNKKQEQIISFDFQRIVVKKLSIIASQIKQKMQCIRQQYQNHLKKINHSFDQFLQLAPSLSEVLQMEINFQKIYQIALFKQYLVNNGISITLQAANLYQTLRNFTKQFKDQLKQCNIDKPETYIKLKKIIVFFLCDMKKILDKGSDTIIKEQIEQIKIIDQQFRFDSQNKIKQAQNAIQKLDQMFEQDRVKEKLLEKQLQQFRNNIKNLHFYYIVLQWKNSHKLEVKMNEIKQKIQDQIASISSSQQRQNIEFIISKLQKNTQKQQLLLKIIQKNHYIILFLHQQKHKLLDLIKEKHIILMKSLDIWKSKLLKYNFQNNLNSYQISKEITNIFKLIKTNQNNQNILRQTKTLKQHLQSFLNDIDENVKKREIKNYFKEESTIENQNQIQPEQLQIIFKVYWNIQKDQSFWSQKDFSVLPDLISEKLTQLFITIKTILQNKIKLAQNQSQLQCKLKRYKSINQLIQKRKEQQNKKATKSVCKFGFDYDNLKNEIKGTRQRRKTQTILKQIQQMFKQLNRGERFLQYYKQVKIYYQLTKGSQYKNYKQQFVKQFEEYLKNILQLRIKQQNTSNVNKLADLSELLSFIQQEFEDFKTKQLRIKQIQELISSARKQIQKQQLQRIQTCKRLFQDKEFSQAKKSIQQINDRLRYIQNNDLKMKINCLKQQIIKNEQLQEKERAKFSKKLKLFSLNQIIELTKQQVQCHKILSVQSRNVQQIIKKSILQILDFEKQVFQTEREQQKQRLNRLFQSIQVLKEYVNQTIFEKTLLTSIEAKFQEMNDILHQQIKNQFLMFNALIQRSVIESKDRLSLYSQQINKQKDIFLIASKRNTTKQIKQLVYQLEKMIRKYCNRFFLQMDQQKAFSPQRIRKLSILQSQISLIQTNIQIQIIQKSVQENKLRLAKMLNEIFDTLSLKVEQCLQRPKDCVNCLNSVKSLLQFISNTVFDNSYSKKLIECSKSFQQKLSKSLQKYRPQFEMCLNFQNYIQSSNNFIKLQEERLTYRISQQLQFSYFYEQIMKIVHNRRDRMIIETHKWLDFYQKLQNQINYFNKFGISSQFIFDNRHIFRNQKQMLLFTEKLNKKFELIYSFSEIKLENQQLANRQNQIVVRIQKMKEIFPQLLQNELIQLGKKLKKLIYDNQQDENCILKIEQLNKQGFLFLQIKHYLQIQDLIQFETFIKQTESEIVKRLKLSLEQHQKFINLIRLKKLSLFPSTQKKYIQQIISHQISSNREQILKQMQSKKLKQSPALNYILRKIQIQNFPQLSQTNQKSCYKMQLFGREFFKEFQKMQQELKNTLEIKFLQFYKNKIQQRVDPFSIILAFLSKLLKNSFVKPTNEVLTKLSKISEEFNKMSWESFKNRYIEGSFQQKQIVKMAFIMYFSLNGVNVYISTDRCQNNFDQSFDIFVNYMKHSTETQIVFAPLHQLLKNKLKQQALYQHKKQVKQRPKQICIIDLENSVDKSFISQSNLFLQTYSLQKNDQQMKEKYFKLFSFVYQFTKQHRKHQRTVSDRELQQIAQQIKQQFNSQGFGSDFIRIMDKQLKTIVLSSLQFNHTYQVCNNKIVYPDFQGKQIKSVFGYKTIFAHFQQQEKGRINKQQLKNSIKIAKIYKQLSYITYLQLFDYLALTTTPQKNILKVLQDARLSFKNITEYPIENSIRAIKNQNLLFSTPSNSINLISIIKSKINQKEQNTIICFENYQQLQYFIDKHSKQLINYRQNFVIIDEVEQPQEINTLKWQSLSVFVSVLLTTKLKFISLNTSNDCLQVRHKRIEFYLTFLPDYEVEYNQIRSMLRFLSENHQFFIVVTPQQARKVPNILNESNKSLFLHTRMVQNQKQLIQLSQRSAREMISDKEKQETLQKYHNRTQNITDYSNRINEFHKQIQNLDQYKRIIIAIDSGYISAHWDLVLCEIVKNLFVQFQHKLLVKIVVFRSYESGKELLSYTGYESDYFLLLRFLKYSLKSRKNGHQHQMRCFEYIESQLRKHTMLKCIFFIASNPSLSSVQIENSRRLIVQKESHFQHQSNINKGQLLSQIDKRSTEIGCKLHFVYISTEKNDKFNGESEYQYLSLRFNTKFNRVYFKQLNEAFLTILQVFIKMLNNIQ